MIREIDGNLLYPNSPFYFFSNKKNFLGFLQNKMSGFQTTKIHDALENSKKKGGIPLDISSERIVIRNRYMNTNVK
jgi:hypothetical protein